MRIFEDIGRLVTSNQNSFRKGPGFSKYYKNGHCLEKEFTKITIFQIEIVNLQNVAKFNMANFPSMTFFDHSKIQLPKIFNVTK